VANPQRRYQALCHAEEAPQLPAGYATMVLVALFPPIDTDPVWHVVPWVWTPAATLHDRQERDRAPYEQWVAEGHLIAVPGTKVNHQVIRDTFLHSAHHRGQMTVYLRLLGSKVPSVYGPTADDRSFG